MTVPTNLFIDAPDVEDVSMTHLSSDSTQWPEEVITKLKERIPAVANMSLSVKFMHEDEENGAATGSVTVTTGEKTAVVPAIVKNFSLYPLDIIMCEGKIIPLNPDSFASIFASGTESAFGNLDEFPALTQIDRYLRGESLQNAMFPPNWGRYAFASANDTEGKPYPILASIVDTVDGSKLQKLAQEDNASFARLYSTPHFELFQKLSSTRPVNMGEYRQGVDNLVMRTLHVLKKDGPNKYTLLSNMNKQFSPAITPMDRDVASQFCSKVSDKPSSILHELDQNGEKIIIPEDIDGDAIFVARPHTEAIVMADSYGRYNVRTNKTGVNVEGIVVPKVIDFDQNPVGAKLFLGKTLSTIQTEISGTRMDGMSDWKPCGGIPAVGQTGTFLLRDGEKGAVATVPVTIKSVHSEGCCGYNEMKIKAIDLSGKEIRLKTSGSKELQRIAKLDYSLVDGTQRTEYTIPGCMEWIPMEGFDEISSNPMDYAIKLASHKLTGNPIVLLNRGYNEYELRGLDKYASHMGWNKTALDSTQAKFLLVSCNLGTQNVEKAMKVAQVTGKSEIHGITYPEIVNIEKVAAEKLAAPTLNKFIDDNLKANMLKVASYVENAQTVDAMLSLNFVNPTNISKFITKIPLFKAALSNLAACLLASRLGVKEIPEESTSSAISKLNDVIKGLEILRSTQGQQKK